MKLTTRLLALAAGLLVATAGLQAQASGTPPTTGVLPARPSMPNGTVNLTPRPGASLTDVQELIRQFDAQRDALLAQRREELAKLLNATAERRAAILAEMQAAQAQRQGEQRELARRIREQLKELRDARRNGGG